MTWFLRLFAAFRRLEAQSRVESEHRILLEDRVRLLQGKSEESESRARAAEAEARETLKKFIDFMALNTTQRKVFSTDVPEAVIGPRPDPVRRRGMQGRDHVLARTAEFFASREQQQTEESTEEFYRSAG